MRILEHALKWVLLAVAIAWVYAYWERRAVGRYAMSLKSNNTILVTDTKTGATWMLYSADLSSGPVAAWVELGGPNGHRIGVHPLQTTDKAK